MTTKGNHIFRFTFLFSCRNPNTCWFQNACVLDFGHSRIRSKTRRKIWTGPQPCSIHPPCVVAGFIIRLILMGNQIQMMLTIKAHPPWDSTGTAAAAVNSTGVLREQDGLIGQPSSAVKPKQMICFTIRCGEKENRDSAKKINKSPAPSRSLSSLLLIPFSCALSLSLSHTHTHKQTDTNRNRLHQYKLPLAS